jgi:hypothetical protein
VTPNAATKVYGSADPAFTGTLSGFLVADGVTASYSRTAGETVLGGPYTISATLSPAAVLSNYAITYNTAAFTITTKAASVTPNAATKVYGSADPAFTGTLSGFLVTDGVAASYSRTAGETVLGGPYTISATLSPAAVLSNYAITYNTATFTITTKAASVTPNAATKVYGSADPAFTGSLSGFLAADGVTATYSRTSGEAVLGSPYTISATLNPASVLSNYSITYNTANFTITAKPATWTTNNNSKVYGASDPNPLTTGSGSGFLAADNVTATYTRVAGELPGTYHITATLSPTAVLSNYTITNNGATFSIGYGTCTGPNPGGVILQPINADGSSVFKVGTRTIPVKFTVCDANGNPISDPMAVFGNSSGSITLLSAVRGTVNGVNDTGTNDIPDVAFRYSDGIWIFNMATSNLNANTTYSYRINLANGSILFRFGTK